MSDLAKAAEEYPGWVARLLAHPVKGLENYRQLIDTLTMAYGEIESFMEIAPLVDGSGLGASHQTGWTGLVAELLQREGERRV